MAQHRHQQGLDSESAAVGQQHRQAPAVLSLLCVGCPRMQQGAVIVVDLYIS